MSRLSLGEYIRQLNNEHNEHRIKVAFTSVLALFVVFSVVWALRVQGISLTDDVDCGKEEHIHISECYEMYQVCGYKEGEAETKKNAEADVNIEESDFEIEESEFEIEETDLENDQEQVIKLHVHDETCYVEELICSLEEHTHTVECMEVEDDSKEVDGSETVKEKDTTDNSNELEDGGIEADKDGSEDRDSEHDPDIYSDLESGNNPDKNSDLESDNDPDEYGDWYSDYDPDEYGDWESEDDIPPELLAKLKRSPGIMLLAGGDPDPSPAPQVIGELTDEKIKQYIKEYAESHTVVPGRIYVVTATGVRDKDEVHEYLEEAHGEKENLATPLSRSSETPYKNGYLINDSHDDYRYYTHTNLPYVLCVYRNNAMSGNYIYPSSGDSAVSHTNTDVNDVSGANFVNAVYAKVTPTIEGRAVTFSIGGGDDFYTYTRYNDRGDYDHADIEITDGGFFKITTKRVFADGRVQLIETRYDSYVSEVVDCRLYGDEDETRLVMEYVSTDYEAKHEKGQTQFELTSKYKCTGKPEKMYRANDVDHVVFDLMLKLAPTESTVTVYKSDNIDPGNIERQYKNDFADENGNFTYEIKPISVVMGKQSVMDALNKCPNHSGLDFNLYYTATNSMVDQPTNARINARKELAGNIDDYSKFNFTLYDSEGTVIDVYIPDSSGNLNIPEFDYPIPGIYRYKLKENIPTGATLIEGDTYYYNGVRYDGREIDIEVEVTSEPTIEYIVKNPVDNKIQPINELRANVNYIYKGENLGVDEVVFTNEGISQYKTKQLRVEKIWNGTNGDSITFRIIQIKNGVERKYFVDEEDYSSIFELSDTKGWSKTFTVPVEIGDDTYEYEVQETKMAGYSASYKKTENETVITLTITNTADEEKELHLKKVWLDEDGNEKTTDLPDKVSMRLYRNYKEVEVPIKVELKSSTSSDYTQEFTLYGYKDQTVSFKLESRNGLAEKLEVLSTTENCQCTCSSAGVYTISDIDNYAVVRLQYNDAPLLWHTDSAGFVKGSDGSELERWTAFQGATLNECTYTYNSSGTGHSGYMIGNRTHNWDQARLRISTTDYEPGEHYSFSAYVRCDRTFTDTSNTKSTVDDKVVQHLKIQLFYTDKNGELQYDDIAVTEGSSINYGEWYHLVNTDFQIPKDIRNVYLLVDSQEADAGVSRYQDIYFDDVIIAPVGVNPSVDRSGNLVIDKQFSLTNEKVLVPDDAKNWTLDSEFRIDEAKAPGYHGLTIEKTSDWKKSYELIEDGFKEVINREYQYYIEEVDTEVLKYYKVSYYDNNVSYNSSDNPITIVNQYNAYQLPNTGGIGTTRIRWLGLLILLAGIPPTLYSLVRKRGKQSG